MKRSQQEYVGHKRIAQSPSFFRSRKSQIEEVKTNSFFSSRQQTNKAPRIGEPHTPFFSNPTPPSIQLLPEEFQIEGQFGDQLEYPNRIFFDAASSVLNEIQKIRIERFFENQHVESPISLTGLASEEGNRDYNLHLASNRAQEVEKEVRRLRPEIKVDVLPSRIEFGEIDYKFSRAVVINENSDDSKQPDERSSTDCNRPNLLSIQSKARGLIKKTIDKVDEQIHHETIRTLLGDPLDKVKLKGDLRQLDIQLGEILKPGKYACGDPENIICRSGAAAYANSATFKVTFCPEGPNNKIEDDNALTDTMIHETLHITPGLMTKDYAYVHDPLIAYLKQPQLVQNTDSYVVLIRRLTNTRSDSPAALAGTTDGFSDLERDKIREAFAWATSAVKSCQFQVAALYEAVYQTTRSGKWPEELKGYVELYKTFTPTFNLHPLNDEDYAVHLQDEDRWKLAGVHEHLKKLSAKVNSPYSRFNIMRDNSVADIAIQYMGFYNNANVDATFPDKSLDFRIKAVLLDMMQQNNLDPKYAQVVEDIQDFMEIKWP